MNILSLVIVLAVTVEALVEYAKSIEQLAYTHNKRPLIIQLGALAASAALCMLAGANIYDWLGVSFTFPIIGNILTGIFASRGANYISDLIGRLRKSGSYFIEETSV